MIKARVSSYMRMNKRGGSHRVRSHIRTVKNRGGHYRIEETRQLPHRDSSIAKDQRIQALEPGKRLSRNDRTYYERRFNRSDADDYL